MRRSFKIILTLLLLLITGSFIYFTQSGYESAKITKAAATKELATIKTLDTEACLEKQLLKLMNAQTSNDSKANAAWSYINTGSQTSFGPEFIDDFLGAARATMVDAVVLVNPDLKKKLAASLDLADLSAEATATLYLNSSTKCPNEPTINQAS